MQGRADAFLDYYFSDNNVPDSGPTEVKKIIFKHFFCFYKIQKSFLAGEM